MPYDRTIGARQGDRDTPTLPDRGRREAMTQKDQPDPERVEALRSLPAEITRTLTREEVVAFLFDDEWPDSLREKLKDYLA